MILHKLTLNNVGLFRGKQTIHLTPNSRKPIILIGGMNGVGKTTLLDAIRLCLYGRRTLGNRVKLSEYHEHLSKIIHRNPNSDLTFDSASVSLEFEYARDNEKKEYRVERFWKRQKNRKTVKEELTIYENNKLNTGFETEHRQDYINELIPFGISQFFFFDGENIQKLVDDSSHDVFLQESIKRLLGLNLVERLQLDLRIYADRLAKHRSPEPVQKKIKEVESEIDTLRSLQTELEEHAESLHTQIEKIEAQITRQESRITAEGGGYVEKRESLKLRRGQLFADIEGLENDIRYLCGGLFPFILIPDLLKQLADRLLKEIKLGEWEAKNHALETLNTEVLETLTSATFWDDVSLSTAQIDAVQAKIVPLLKTQFECPEALHDFKKIRERSPSECSRLLEWIDVCLNNVPQKFGELNNALRKAQLELQRIEEVLQKVPAEEVLRPLIEKLSVLNQARGQLHKRAQDTDQSIHSLSYQLQEAERKLKELHHTQQLGEAHVQRQKRVEDVQSVLRTYTTRFTQAKTATLGNAIVESFNQLSHKSDRIKRVKLDPQTFTVTLYDVHNRALLKEELSAGEKQIYTTALLWALAKTSGKALPMILDTPLGRLDGNHRQLLIEHYFPYACHQVVLLSTDTEIGGSLYSLLEPHVSHTFHLAYQSAEGCTTIEEGYFR